MSCDTKTEEEKVAGACESHENRGDRAMQSAEVNVEQSAGDGDGDDGEKTELVVAISISPAIASKPIGYAALSNRYSYPLLYVSPYGTISVMFRSDVFVEMTVDKTVRVLCAGKFSAATNARGTCSCIVHSKARVYQSDTHVYCELDKEKLAVFGSQGIIFTMKRLANSYLVSSTSVKGTAPIRSQFITYPSLQTDFTMNLLYVESVCGEAAVAQCHGIVRNAKYEIRDDGIITVTMNGILMKQLRNGDLSVHNRPRCIRASPSNNTVSVRTHFVDMGVQEDDKAFVQRGVKRIHSSRSARDAGEADVALVRGERRAPDLEQRRRDLPGQADRGGRRRLAY